MSPLQQRYDFKMAAGVAAPRERIACLVGGE